MPFKQSRLRAAAFQLFLAIDSEYGDGAVYLGDSQILAIIAITEETNGVRALLSENGFPSGELGDGEGIVARAGGDDVLLDGVLGEAAN